MEERGESNLTNSLLDVVTPRAMCSSRAIEIRLEKKSETRGSRSRRGSFGGKDFVA